MTSSPSCPACGGHAILKFSKNIDLERFSSSTFSSRKVPELMHHDYFECDECRYLFSVDIDLSDLVSLYRESSHDSSKESELAANTYLYLFQTYIQDEVRSVLDVGCSDGKFLNKLVSSGIPTAVGIEPSVDAAKMIDRSSINVFEGSLEDFRSESLFDVVFLLQTIEHIPNPGDVLKRLMGLVKPSGALMVVCHDRFSLVNRILGQRSPIFDVEHLQIFNRESIVRIVERNDFKVETVSRFMNRYPFSYAIRLGAANLLGNVFVKRLLNRWDPLIPFPAGNLVVVIRHRQNL
jgi:2-polyprenyl-3-methyl-5-hydroxy-6-metoxy-1,4-benzoquinol methylase